MKAIQKTPPKSFTDALLELAEWIERRENSLANAAFIISEPAAMEQRISLLKVRMKTATV